MATNVESLEEVKVIIRDASTDLEGQDTSPQPKITRVNGGPLVRSESMTTNWDRKVAFGEKDEQSVQGTSSTRSTESTFTGSEGDGAQVGTDGNGGEVEMTRVYPKMPTETFTLPAGGLQVARVDSRRASLQQGRGRPGCT